MKIFDTKFNSRLFKDIFTETWKGKSLDRILLNHNLRSVQLGGKILDLGAGSTAGSYHRFIQYQEPYSINFTDLYKNMNDSRIIAVDLEKKFDLADESYDAITCFNVLEHVFDYNNLLTESCRILKTNGVFVGSVPFLVNYHPDPNDFWRYTWQTLEKIFHNAGFQCDKMVYLGYGPLTAGMLQSDFMFPKFIKPLFYLIVIGLDNFLLRWKKFLRHKHVMGYLFILSKLKKIA